MRKCESSKCMKNWDAFGLTLAVRKFSELDGKSKNIAVACFIMEEMVSGGGLRAVSA